MISLYYVSPVGLYFIIPESEVVYYEWMIYLLNQNMYNEKKKRYNNNLGQAIR